MASQESSPIQPLVCPTCGGQMVIQHLGSLEDKVAVCQSCGTTVDLKDSFQRVKTVRRQKPGWFGPGELVEEEMVEIRSDQPFNPMTSRARQVATPASPSQITPLIILVAVVMGVAAVVAIFTTSRQPVSAPEPPLMEHVGVSISSTISSQISTSVSITIQDGLGNVVGAALPVVQPSIRQIEGHVHPVREIVYSPSGDRFVMLSADTAQLWDAEALDVVETWRGVSAGAAFSPDGQFLAVVGGSELQVRDGFTGSLMRSLGNGYGSVVEFSPDGEKIASVTLDGVVRLLSLEGEELVTFGGQRVNHYNLLRFSPDGQMVVAGGNAYQLAVWEVTTGEQLYLGNTSIVTIKAADFSPDGQFLAIGDGATIRLFRLEQGQPQLAATWNGPDAFIQVQSLDYSADGRFVLTGDFFSKAVVWDAVSGQAVRQLQGIASVSAATFNPDGSRALGVGNGALGNQLYVWDLAN